MRHASCYQTSAALIQKQATPCGMSGGESEIGQEIFPSFYFSHASIIPPVPHNHSFLIDVMIPQPFHVFE